jgi:hypothetical protein
MRTEKSDRSFPAIRLAETSQAEDPTASHKGMLAELVRRLDTHHVFAKGQFVVWKAGLKNKVRPDYGEPAIVTAVYRSPIYDRTEACSASPYFREPLSLVIGVYHEDDLVELHVDGRRFEPASG